MNKNLPNCGFTSGNISFTAVLIIFFLGMATAFAIVASNRYLERRDEYREFYGPGQYDADYWN